MKYISRKKSLEKSQKKTKPTEPKLGRPSLYDEKYCEELLAYFSIAPYRVVEKTVVTKSGDAVRVEEAVANDMPNFAGFAIKIGLHRSTLHDWTKRYPEFDYAWKMAKEHQENYMITNGLKGTIDRTFAIFASKNILDWRDKTEQEVKATVESSNAQVYIDEFKKVINAARDERKG